MQPRRSRRERALLDEFGARVRALSVERGLSQEALGELAGLDRTYIGGMERGERNVAVLNIERVASALGVDPGDLLAGLGGR